MAGSGFALRVSTIFLAAVTAKAAGSCDLNYAFTDIRDGGAKHVAIEDTKMTVRPTASNEDWVVETVIDCDAGGQAIVPSAPLTGTLFDGVNCAGGHKYSFVFTDPSGAYAEDAHFPINTWVAQMQGDLVPHRPDCPTALAAPSAVKFADILHGDVKEVSVDGTTMTITPFGNGQNWTVTAELDPVHCTTVVDFDVPGFPYERRGKWNVTYWKERTSGHPADQEESVWEFTVLDTDPEQVNNRYIELRDAALTI